MGEIRYSAPEFINPIRVLTRAARPPHRKSAQVYIAQPGQVRIAR